MRIVSKYDHLNALEIILQNNGVWRDIEEILTSPELQFSKGNSQTIKKSIEKKFSLKGWADRVSLGNSKLTISFLRDKVGVCFQIGNVARTYADILKLVYLCSIGVIQVAVIIVPDNVESKKLGANYASFERLKNEIKLFQNILNVPIMVIGLSN
jgi:aspartyl-tRNA synthetase